MAQLGSNISPSVALSIVYGHLGRLAYMLVLTPDSSFGLLIQVYATIQAKVTAISLFFHHCIVNCKDLG